MAKEITLNSHHGPALKRAWQDGSYFARVAHQLMATCPDYFRSLD
ncbi:hypothetical protein [Synechococcus sp. BIOS-E4-1]|nr:hypothetical protein [Synechococcus sp. BIOS-E4-1]